MSNISRSRLLATSAIAGLSMLQPAGPAAAQQSFGIHNDQPETLDVVVAEDEEVVGGDIGVYADNGPVEVDNAGAIRGNGTSPGSAESRPSGGIVIAQPGSSVVNSGEIIGAANGIATTYFFGEDANDDPLPPAALAADTSVVNTGTIMGQAGAGVALAGGGTVVNDDGVIRGLNGAPGSGINGIGVVISEFPEAIAEGVSGIGTITNIDEGIIEGQTYGIILQGGGTIDNSGRIQAGNVVSPANGVAPIAIIMGASPEQEGRSATLNNDGVVLGLIGVFAGGSLETTTINNGGIINGAFTAILGGSSGDLVVNNEAGADIGAGGFGIQSGTSKLTVDNAGSIRGDSQHGINITSADAVINNSGTITGGQAGITTNLAQVGAGVFEALAGNSSITNSGTVIGNAGAAISLIGGGSVTNDDGLIRGLNGAPGSGVAGIGVVLAEFPDAIAEGVTGIGTITNIDEGIIEGQTFGIVLSGGGTIDNDGGTIRATGQFDPATPGAQAPIGIILTATPEQQGRSATLNNEGVVGGLIGVFAGGPLETTTINNGGIINGAFTAILGQTTGALVVNNGEGADIGAGGFGIQSGANSLTVDNAGTIRGDSQTGVNITSAEAAVTNSGAITGGANGVTGSGGALTLDNSGTIRGNGRGDGINASPNGGVAISGDTSTITNSGDISGAQFGIVTFPNFDPATGVATGTIVDTTIVNSGTITGENDDGIRLAGGGTITNSGTIQGLAQNAFGGTDGVSIFSHNDQDLEGYSGALINEEGGVISGIRSGAALSSGGSVTNAGTITGEGQGVFIQGNALDGVAREGQIATLENSGTISGTGDFGGTSLGGHGVSFGSNLETATLTNSGTITSAFAEGVAQASLADLAITNQEGGVIEGGTSGIYGGSSGTMTVVNAGTIRGNGAYDGFEAAPDAGITIGTAGSSVDNSGAISGAGAGITTAYLFDEEIGDLVGLAVDTQIVNSGTIVGETNDGVRLIGGGSVVNSGVIRAETGAGADGVSMYAYVDQANEDFSASVSNEAGGEIEGARFGIILSGGGSVDNAGDIAGGDGGVFIQGTAINTDPSEDRSGLTASVVNSGTISGTRADGLNGYGLGFGSDLSTATLENSGTISSVAAAGVFHGTLGDVTITNTADGVIEGGSHGVSGEGEGTLTLSNAGTIRSEAGIGIASISQATLENSGTIIGGSGVAVQLGAFDDSVTLKTGSAVTGVIDAGDGIDSLTLDGDILELTEAQQIGAAANFETLEVAGGYWSTDGFVGEFGSVAINEGGALQVNEVTIEEEGETFFSSPIFTPTVVNNGLLAVNFSESDVVSGLGALSVTGTGAVQLLGEAVFTLDTDSFVHTGGTIVSNGGLVLTGTLLGDVTTEGDGFFQLGAGGTEGNFAGDIVNNGAFVFNRSDDYDFLGAFSGSGSLVKNGDSILSFLGDYSFTGTTNILAGSIRFGGVIDPGTEFNLGGGELDISGTDQTIGGLSGGEEATVVIDGSELTVDQADNTQFAGDITGDGSLVKDGEGILNLTGTNSYTGPTSVNGGTLAVNGSITSDVTVNAGGKLGGNGSVGDTTVTDNGTLAPGNSIGRLTVAGDLTLAPGSIYEVEVNAAGQADRVDATGAVTIASTAAVEVLAEAGTYAPRTDYVILTGAGGLTGTFGSVTTDMAFLDPFLRYSANAVTLSLYRNDIDFADVAANGNQASVAAAVQSLGIDNILFETVLMQNAATAQASFADLSGEIHASTVSGLADDSRHLRNTLLDLQGPAESGLFVWGSAFGGWGDFDANRGSFGMETDHKGIVTGIGYGGNGFAAALSAGLGSSDFSFDGTGDNSDVESKYLAAHATYGAGEGFRAGVGLSYAWHDIDTSRTIGGALAQTLTSKRDGETLQLFGELGYDVVSGKAAITPFLRLAHVDAEADAVAEAGGNAALILGKTDIKTTFLSLGARVRFNAGEEGFQPFASAAWNRAFDDRAAAFDARFAAGGPAFRIFGSAIPKNSAEVEAGFDYASGNFRIGAAYSGTLASDRNSHGARITARIAF